MSGFVKLINKMKAKYELGQIVDLVIDGRSNCCEIITVTKSTDTLRGGEGVFYDVIFEQDEAERFIARGIRQGAITDVKRRKSTTTRDPLNQPLYSILEGLKDGRTDAEKLWLQQHIDQLKLVDDAQKNTFPEARLPKKETEQPSLKPYNPKP